jgi:hypothetical protein
MPEKVKITGSPTLAVPLGGPGFDIDEYLSISSVQAMIGGEGESSGLAAYEYVGAPGTNPTQTFLIHYPIDAIEYKISPEALDFNHMQEEIEMPEGTPFYIKIPEIKPTSMLEIVIHISEDIKNLVSRASDDDPITLPGDFGPILLNLAGPGFNRAKIGTGRLVFGNEGENLNFSEVSFTLKGGSIPDQQINGQDRTCPLNGKVIFEDTNISLSGTIKTTAGMLKNKAELSIPIDVEITHFSEIAIASPDKITAAIPVDLTYMAAWVESVTFQELGITLKIAPRIDGLNVNFHAPVFGIDETQISSETTFKEGMAFSPSDDYILNLATDYSPITITVGRQGDILTLYDVTPGDPIELAIAIEQPLVFDWTKAVVYPNKLFDYLKTEAEKDPNAAPPPQFNGHFPADGEQGFDLSQFTESLNKIMAEGEIDKIEFDSIPMNLYVTGADVLSSISIKMDARYNSDTVEQLTEGKSQPLKKMSEPLGDFPTDGKYLRKLPDASFSTDLAGIFNAKPKDLFLDYELMFEPTMTLYRDGGDLNLTLKPDLIIELPLKFKIAAEEQPDDNGKYYAQLDLQGLIPQTSGDLLGRTGPNDPLDENLEYVDYISFNVNYTNTLGLSGTSILLTVKEDTETRFSKPLLQLWDGGPHESLLQLQVEDLKYPFKPEIEIKIDAKQRGGYGILEIKQGKKLEIAITVQVKARIDQEIEL